MIRKTLDKVKDTLRENKTLLLAAAVTGIVFGITLGLISDGMAHNATKSPENLIADTEATESTETEEVKEALKDRNVFFAGMDNISADENTIVRLENLKDNGDILISYVIQNNSTGEELFRTDLIPSGHHVDWKPSETLEEGSYDICYVQNPVWQDKDGNYIPLTSASNVATLTLTLPKEDLRVEGGATS